MDWKIQIGGRSFRRFIPHPQTVRDGTSRCIACGQIDEPEHHVREYCPGQGGKLPLTDKAKRFLSANERSGVVMGSAQDGGGAYYRLANGQTFRLTLYEVRALPMPNWQLPHS